MVVGQVNFCAAAKSIAGPIVTPAAGDIQPLQVPEVPQTSDRAAYDCMGNTRRETFTNARRKFGGNIIINAEDFAEVFICVRSSNSDVE